MNMKTKEFTFSFELTDRHKSLLGNFHISANSLQEAMVEVDKKKVEINASILERGHYHGVSMSPGIISNLTQIAKN